VSGEPRLAPTSLDAGAKRTLEPLRGNRHKALVRFNANADRHTITAGAREVLCQQFRDRDSHGAEFRPTAPLHAARGALAGPERQNRLAAVDDADLVAIAEGECRVRPYDVVEKHRERELVVRELHEIPGGTAGWEAQRGARARKRQREREFTLADTLSAVSAP
jgi:hypothetical protein